MERYSSDDAKKKKLSFSAVAAAEEIGYDIARAVYFPAVAPPHLNLSANIHDFVPESLSAVPETWWND